MGLFNQSNIFQLNQLQEGRHVREKIFQLIYILESYPRDESSMQRIVHATNCPCDELSMRRIVRDELSATNCPCDELSGRPFTPIYIHIMPTYPIRDKWTQIGAGLTKICMDNYWDEIF